MSHIKINYCDLSPDNPDNIDLIVREDISDSKNKTHGQCPVFRHKKNRTFIGYSPLDFEMRIKENTIFVSDKEQVDWVDIDTSIKDRVFQLKLATFGFCTDEPDVWMEYTSHPLTSLNNNFTVVEGWFNLFNWSRGTSLAIQFVDETKPIKIKKGDPLFKVSFLSSDLNRGVILNKISTRNFQINEAVTHSFDHKSYKKGNKLFSKSKKKCPFNFLLRWRANFIFTYLIK